MIARLDVRVRASLAVVVAFACFGCSKSKPTEPPPDGGPNANSAANAVRRLEFAYDNRDAASNRTLFTSDFQFNFVPGDSAGFPYQVTPWNRTDELASFDNVSASATSIDLSLDGNLTVSVDPRPGKNPTWHKSVNTHVVLIATFPGGVTKDITGRTTFFLVRGDSAAIPPDLGVGPDSTLWYMDRWDDDTGELGSPKAPPPGKSDGPQRALPVQNNSWGRLKTENR